MMRALTMKELEIVGGGLLKQDDGSGGSGGGGGGITTEPPVVVTAPATWYPPLIVPSNPSDLGSGGAAAPFGGGGSGSDGKSHTTALTESINDAFGIGSAVVNYTNGQATGASYTWQDYQSTSTVTGAQDHLTEFTNVALSDGHSVSAGIDIKADTVTLRAGLGIDPFDVGVTVNNANLGAATLTLKDSSGTSLSENWTTAGQLNTTVSQKFGDWTVSGTESTVTGTAQELVLKVASADGTTETFELVHDSASSPTNHGGWGVSYQIAVPLD